MTEWNDSVDDDLERLDASRLDGASFARVVSSDIQSGEEEYEEHHSDGFSSDQKLTTAFQHGVSLFEAKGLVDIGNLAYWSVSSYKEGCGIRELREDNPFSYWQSDDEQPHSIEIHFTKRVQIERISLFMDHTADESYTPSQIAVLAGTGEHDLAKVKTAEFFNPVGWEHVVFDGIRHDNLLKCFYIKIMFLTNHQNGKDTHLRGLKVLAPLAKTSMGSNVADIPVSFTSSALLSESVLR